MSRLETLKKLETILENFLDKAVDMEKERLETIKAVEALSDINRESLRGRYVNNRLGDWFARHREPLAASRFSESELTTIGNLLSSIRSGLDAGDPETVKLADQIDHWRRKGVVPKRKLILKMPAREGQPETDDRLNRFLDMLARQQKYLGSGEFDGIHILSILEDTLKAAEAKVDPMYLHLAGSLVYFLKINGYKVAPFARRLREIEKAKSDNDME